MIVLSSATTGRRPASASATSGWTRTGVHPSLRSVWGEDPKLVELLGERGAAGFRALFDGFPDLVGVLWALRDEDGRIVDFAFGYGNPSMLRSFRLPAAT